MPVVVEDDLPGKLIVNWFKSSANVCMFAKGVSAKIRPFTFFPSIPPPDELVELVDGFLMPMAADSLAALFVFPSIRTEEEVADLLTSLTKSPRFKLVEFQWPPDTPRREILVGLDWQTPSRHQSRSMGLAPFGHMPVTRRAPFVSILIWPGGHENPYRPDDYATVGVADMNADLDRDKFAQWWDQTKAAKKERVSLEPTRSAAFREVAFCLDARVRERLAFQSTLPTISSDQW